MNKEEAKEFLNLLSDDIHESRHDLIILELEKRNYFSIKNDELNFIEAIEYLEQQLQEKDKVIEELRDQLCKDPWRLSPTDPRKLCRKGTQV